MIEIPYAWVKIWSGRSAMATMMGWMASPPHVVLEYIAPPAFVFFVYLVAMSRSMSVARFDSATGEMVFRSPFLFRKQRYLADDVEHWRLEDSWKGRPTLRLALRTGAEDSLVLDVGEESKELLTEAFRAVGIPTRWEAGVAKPWGSSRNRGAHFRTGRRPRA